LAEGIFILPILVEAMARATTAIPKSKKSITLEREIETKVRKIQARLIEKTDKTWSLSTVLNILITAGLLHTRKISGGEWQKIRSLVEKKTINFDEATISDFVKKIG
jgi:hypothetical protein